VIPEGWNLKLLGDGINLLSGRHVLAKDYGGQPIGVPYLTGPADFPNGTIVTTKYTQKPGVTCQPGDILLTVKGSGTGKLIRADQEYCISRQLMAIRAKKWDQDFVYHYLTHNSSRYKAAAVGLIPGISRDDVLQTPILVPPLFEQRKIAEILSTWDEAITLTNRRVEAARQRRRGLMQRLLTGRVRFEEFQDDSWRKVQLGRFLALRLRKVSKPSTCYSALGVRSHGKGVFTKEVDNPDTVAMSHLYVVREGDLIVNITFAWEGAIALAEEGDEGRLVSHRFPTYVFDHRKVAPDFFKYLMVTKRFFHELGLISPGGAGRNRVMSKRDFLKIEVNLPALGEQQRCAEVLCCADREIALLTQKRDALQRQKQGLMQRLLTGRVRVKM
jgi:type I restriction enzyme S subunit